jgi:hypothetical protein
MDDFVRSLAFFIAIDQYDNGIPALTTPVADAKALADILSKLHGYETEIIANEQATLSGLRSFLSELPDRIGPDDRVVFYFAGHGIALTGDDGPRGYIIPQDARKDAKAEQSFFAMTELDNILSELPCRHLLVILDCCFAGAFRWASYRNLVLAPENLHKERYEWFIHDPAWQAIASAAHDQKALDVASEQPLGKRDDTEFHSPFAKALIRGLKGAADQASAGGVGDGVITATELYLYLEVALFPREDDRRRQRPILWPLKKHDKGQFVFLVPGRQLSLPPAPPLTPDADPWRGLEPYEEKHAKLFFGRGKATDELVEKVRKKRLVVVTGPSGIGKSSLVKAGLLPGLKDEAFQIALVRPERTPFATLAKALQGASPPGVNAPDERILATDERALGDWIKSLPGQHEILIVIDQAEELITMSDNEVSKDYLARIAYALDEGEDRLRVLFTLRSEFEPQFAESALKPRWLAQAHYAVPPMTQDELRRVIEGPAAVKVLQFESDELIDQLVNEVVQMPGALPLLSFALSQMYANYLERRSEDRALTFADYEALKGGVPGSLRVRANQVVDGVDGAHRDSARRVLERFVSVESIEYARRRVPQREFIVEDADEQIRVNTVITRLVDARLVVTDYIEGERHLEFAHDALILGWDRLLTWIREDGPFIADLRRLTLDSEKWHEFRKQLGGILWSDPVRVDAIKKLQGRESPGLNKIESEFARKSIESANWKRSRNNFMIAVLALSTGAAMFYAHDSKEQTAEAKAQSINAQNALMRSREPNWFGENAVLALHSLRFKETPEASRILNENISNFLHFVRRFAIPGTKHSVSKNGKYVASWVENEKSIVIWELDEQSYKKYWAASLADLGTKISIGAHKVSTNGRYVAVSFTQDGGVWVRVIEMDDSGIPKLAGRDVVIHDVMSLQFPSLYDGLDFSQDSKYLIIQTNAKYEHSSQVIDIQQGVKLLDIQLSKPERTLYGMSISPDSRYLAACSTKPRSGWGDSGGGEVGPGPDALVVLSLPELESVNFMDMDTGRCGSLNFDDGTLISGPSEFIDTSNPNDQKPMSGTSELISPLNPGEWNAPLYPTPIWTKRPQLYLPFWDNPYSITEELIGRKNTWVLYATAEPKLESPSGAVPNTYALLLDDFNPAVNGVIQSPVKGLIQYSGKEGILSIGLSDDGNSIVVADRGGHITVYESSRRYGRHRLKDIENRAIKAPRPMSSEHLLVPTLIAEENKQKLKVHEVTSGNASFTNPIEIDDVTTPGGTDGTDIFISPDGLLAVLGDRSTSPVKSINVYSLKDGKVLPQILNFNFTELTEVQSSSFNPVNAVNIAFSPPDKYVKELAAVNGFRLAVWDATGGKSNPLAIEDSTAEGWPNRSISFDQSGDFLVTTSGQTITIWTGWRSGKFKEVNSWPIAENNLPFITALQFSHDNKYLIAAVATATKEFSSTAIQVWENWQAPKPKRRKNILLSSQNGWGWSKMSLYSHPKEYLLAVADIDNVYVIDLNGGETWLQAPWGYGKPNIKFADEGRYVVVTSLGAYGYWLWNPKDLIRDACTSVSLPEFTDSKWKSYMGPIEYSSAC